MKKLRVILIIVLNFILFGCIEFDYPDYSDLLLQLPQYHGEPFVIVNNNVPLFTEEELNKDTFEYYGMLDYLGRCQEAFALLGPETLPDANREDISSIIPSGWKQEEYGFIEGNVLYNRCHLIAHSLSGENANKRNLITGTRYMNIEGMLPFESLVLDYIKDTGNHVLYRVVPIFEDFNMVASGVTMEAKSIEDDKISFYVYVYNVQPGVEIDYLSGKSHENENYIEMSYVTYILNTNSHKFHRVYCKSVNDMKVKNKRETSCSKDELIMMGYEPCRYCKP